MKKAFLLIWLLLLTGCAAGGLMSPHMKNTPTNFRGVEFGVNIKNRTDMIVEHESGLITRCAKKDEKMEIMGSQIDKISYNFYKGSFYEGRVLFKGIDNFYNIKSSLYAQHGLSLESKSRGLGLMSGALTGTTHLTPEQTKEKHTWYGGAVYITLQYISGEGILLYQFTPILGEIGK